MQNKPKIIVIVGSTASGKSDLAVRLAKKWRGEVVSADSRQVYKGLSIGTGKITKKEMASIPHHMLDVANPKKQFTAWQYQKMGKVVLRQIIKKGKVPIICGGTGFYIQALVDGLVLPGVKADKKLRKLLEKKSTTELFKILKKLDPERAQNIESKNPRRLIRAIEIAKSLGKIPHLAVEPLSGYKMLFIGIKIEPDILRKKIKKRLLERIKKGMIAEAKKLHNTGLSYKRMDELGLEYRYLAKHLKGEISKEEMIDQLEKKIWQYARRQRQWFKRDKRIIWVNPKENKKVVKTVRQFL